MQKGFAQTLLLVIIFSVLSGFAIYWLFFKTPSVQVKVASPIPSESNPTTVFKNEEIGLEFSLPQGFSVKEENEKEYFKRSGGDIRKNFTYYVKYPPAEFVNSFYVIENGENNLDKAKLAILVFKNPDNMDPQKFYKEYWYYPFIWGEFSMGEKNKIAPTTIELIAGRETKTTTVDFRPGKPKFIYLPHGSKNLILQIHLPSEDNQTGSKILESLKLE